MNQILKPKTESEIKQKRLKNLKVNRKGRPKGSVNKNTAQLKEVLTKLVDRFGSSIDLWILQVAERNPGEAVKLILQAAEYVIPKLQRVEQKNEEVTKIEFSWNSSTFNKTESKIKDIN